DLDVAVGELLVLLLRLAVLGLELGQPLLQLAQALLQLADAVLGVRGHAPGLERGDLEAEPLVLLQQLLGELLGLRDDLEELVPALRRVVGVRHPLPRKAYPSPVSPGPSCAGDHARPCRAWSLRWRKTRSRATPAWFTNTSSASSRPKGRPVSGLSPKSTAIVSRWGTRGMSGPADDEKRPIFPMRYELHLPSGSAPEYDLASATAPRKSDESARGITTSRTRRLMLWPFGAEPNPPSPRISSFFTRKRIARS